METLTRRQQWLDNEDFVHFTQESWESILSLPFEHRFKAMDAYAAISAFSLAAERTGGDFNNEKLWQFMEDHTAGHILVGLFVPAELESLEPLLKSKFEMVRWSDAGIFYKMDMEHPTAGNQRNVVFNTWAKFHEYVTDCFVDDNDDFNEVMDCRFICQKIRHFLSLNPDLPQIKEPALDMAA